MNNTTPTGAKNPGLALAVLCLGAFVINVDTTIVNVTLPTLVRELDASTRDLQWIVDAYNLTFAALVLAAGSLSDRYGRRGALILGLTIFGLASTAGAFVSSTGPLIAARAVMGIGAAIIFPTTLSILTNIFTERRERAKAIGLWAAMSGLGVAFGPITGGWILEHYWWGAVFLVMGPVAAVAIVAALAWVPTSKDPAVPRLDWNGLILSTLFIGLVVFTIIEAPDSGWTATRTLAGFAASVGLLATFIWWERRTPEPMLDVALFRNLRFSAASGSVTAAFFALFGFVFLITQYFQFLKGYTPLGTGVRLLPVAVSIAAASVVGSRLAVTVGSKIVIAGGLGSLAVAFAWTSTASSTTSYLVIAAQMLLLGTGMGLTTATATEAIMGAVPAAKAGIGSAVNDATREFGGTLGVAVIGSVFASLYRSRIDTASLSALPPDAREALTDGIGSATIAIEQLATEGVPPATINQLTVIAQSGFYDGLQAGCLVAAGVAAAGAVFAAIVLPSQPVQLLSTDVSEQPRDSDPSPVSTSR